MQLIYVVAIIMAACMAFFHASNIRGDYAAYRYEKAWLVQKMGYKSYIHRFRFIKTVVMCCAWTITAIYLVTRLFSTL